MIVTPKAIRATRPFTPSRDWTCRQKKTRPSSPSRESFVTTTGSVATAAISTTAAVRLVGPITGRILVPLVSLVGVVVERPLVGSGVVVAPPILVTVGVIAAIAAVGSVAVALVVRAVVIAVATVAGHDDGQFGIGSCEMN